MNTYEEPLNQNNNPEQVSTPAEEQGEPFTPGEIIGIKLSTGEDLVITVYDETDVSYIAQDVMLCHYDRQSGAIIIDQWMYCTEEGLIQIFYHHIIADFVPTEMVLEVYKEFNDKMQEKRNSSVPSLPALEPTGNNSTDSTIIQFENDNKPKTVH